MGEIADAYIWAEMNGIDLDDNPEGWIDYYTQEGCYELCPHCGKEVFLENAKRQKAQKCPSCNKKILPCSLCLYCTRCDTKK